LADREKNIRTAKNTVHTPESSNIPMSVGIGMLAGLLGCLLLTLLLSAILSAQENPMTLLPYFAKAALFIGGFVSGFTATKLYRYSMAGGILSGIGYTAVLWILSFFIDSHGKTVTGMYIGYAIAFLCSLLGSIAAKSPKRSSVRNSSPAAIVRKTRQKYNRV